MTSDTTRPVAVIVDGYTSGTHLPPAFHRAGADVVHVQSTPELMPTMRNPDLSMYAANVVCADAESVEATVARLAQWKPVCVIAGQEPGVPLADRLSELMGLPTNGSSLSAARRDKYEMAEALRRAGVRCADQHKSGDPEDLVKWAEERGVYPVVVKPLDSAATDGVVVCDGPARVREAAEAVLRTQTIFGTPNREALIQSYLAGPEYVVDTVSCNARRYTSVVWRYEKRLANGHNLYDRSTFCRPDEAPAPELIAYVDTVLTALGIEFGPTHAEVIMTAEGPALVEVGARLDGVVHPEFDDLCLGANQVDATALAYVKPAEFLEHYAGRTYRLLSQAGHLFAATELNGVVDGYDQQVIDEIRSLESVHDLTIRLKPGGRIRPTVDLYTSPFLAHMKAASLQAIQADYERIQQLKDQIFRVRT
ncbi:ATP-grasp domain-containing protein [Nonomuraea typhae]|uniref:ATP-grasp domain-containing protein n=1 Tax=Nonomuraea typhae TaxID=2603600 RepID=A0ABW7Z9J0_9ACTN